MMPSRLAELAAAALLSLSAVRAAGAQTLGVDGDRFTVDGQRRFLVFVSYFDGIRRIPDDLASTAILDSDLDYFAAKGVAGLRVFPNWQFRSETLMDCNGTLRPLQVAKLKTLVDRAAAKHLVVDLSFTIDVVKNARGTQCLSAAGYKQALEATTVALLGRTNVFFDLQNEHDKNRPPADKAHRSGWTEGQWTEYLGNVIRPAVKGRDGTRFVTVSWTSDVAPEQVYSNVETYGYDVLAYHHRGAGWETKTAVYVEALKQLFDRRGPARPVYIQEPNRFPFDTTVEHYETAITNAKRSGAAAWTFHNSVVETSKPLKGALPFEQLLEPGERVFLDRLASTGAASSDQTRQFDFAEMSPDIVDGKALLGFRVPTVVASPFTRGDAGRPRVDHNVYDHTSVLKLIEWRWKLAPLTARDASNDIQNLASALQFDRPNADVPVLPQPLPPAPIPCPGGGVAFESSSRSEWQMLLDAGTFAGWPLAR